MFSIAGWRAECSGRAVSPRIPDIFVSIPGDNSAPRRPISRDCARPSRFGLLQFRGTALQVFVRRKLRPLTRWASRAMRCTFLTTALRPVFALAMAWPNRVIAIILQTVNAYEEGLGDAWAACFPRLSFWHNLTTT
jgi:hypothetical protein